MGEGQTVVSDDDQVHYRLSQAKLHCRPQRRRLKVCLQQEGVPTAKGDPGGPRRVPPHVCTGRTLHCQGNQTRTLEYSCWKLIILEFMWAKTAINCITVLSPAYKLNALQCVRTFLLILFSDWWVSSEWGCWWILSVWGVWSTREEHAASGESSWCHVQIEWEECKKHSLTKNTQTDIQGKYMYYTCTTL